MLIEPVFDISLDGDLGEQRRGVYVQSSPPLIRGVVKTRLHPVPDRAHAGGALTWLQPAHVVAAAWHDGGNANPCQLALRVAAHLAENRQATSEDPVAPCLTSAAAPYLPPGFHAVRLPHMVTRRRADALVDVIVWEIVRTRDLERWLGAIPPPSDVRYRIEQEGGRLLNLRHAARTRQLPNTAAGRQLQTMLRRGNLSLRTVYRHPDLVFDTLAGLRRSTRRGPTTRSRPTLTGRAGR